MNHLAARIGVDTGQGTGRPRPRARVEGVDQEDAQEQWVADLRADGFATFDGEASLVDAHTVRVGGVEVEGERMLIATGSHTAVPPVDGIYEIDWIDHVSALELEEVPASVLVVGAGAVGLELGQAFSRFGASVTIVDAADRVAPLADPESSATLAAALDDEGIVLALSAFVQSVRRDGGEVAATIAPQNGAEPFEVRAETLLIAAGRAPNVEGLNLEAVGVEDDAGRSPSTGTCAHSSPGSGRPATCTEVAQFTPVAQYRARIAVADMFGADAPLADYSRPPTAIFTDPEVGGVGLTEAQAREQGHDVGVGRHELVRRSTYIDARHGLKSRLRPRRREAARPACRLRNAGEVVRASRSA